MRIDTMIPALLAPLAITAALAAQCPPGGYGPGIRELPPIPVWNPSDVSRTPPATTAPRPAVPQLPAANPRERRTPATTGVRPAGGPTTPSLPRAVLDLRRDQETARLLTIDWQFVVAPDVEQPLSWERAVALLATGSDKPLLVRRQPHEVEARQAERIREVLDVETMQILSRWFRCVDLPDVTRSPNHPLSGLYVPDHAPLLFVVDADATDPQGFSGFESASAIRAGIEAAIERNYEGDVRRAIRRVQELLGRCDTLHASERDAMLRRDRKLEDGASDHALAKLDTQLFEIREEIAQVLAMQQQIVESLKPRSTVAEPTKGVPAAAGG